MAEGYARKAKVDIFDARPLSLVTEVDSRYSESDYRKYLSKTGVSRESAKSVRVNGPCRYLWCSLVVNPDLSFSPCPLVYDNKDTFGRLGDNVLIRNEVNNHLFTESRKMFKISDYKVNGETPCLRCELFTKP